MPLASTNPDTPPPPTVISALDDEQCRTLLSALDEPRSVDELAEVADVPLSTTYRKVARLRDASLVDERVEVKRTGHHRTQYVLDFDRIVLEMDDDLQLNLDIARPLHQPERQLVEMWSEVRSET